MNKNICENCDNFMWTYADPETHQIYNGCKVCGFKEEQKDKKFIYKTEYDLDLSKVLNTNQHLVSDITLPTIYDNPNIKCINPECKSIVEDLPCNIAYIKYNKDEMLYMYSCNYCGQKWRNN